jgi:hypothetical protein
LRNIGETADDILRALDRAFFGPYVNCILRHGDLLLWIQPPDCTDGLLQNFYALHINRPLLIILPALAPFFCRIMPIKYELIR